MLNLSFPTTLFHKRKGHFTVEGKKKRRRLEREKVREGEKKKRERNNSRKKENLLNYINLAS